MLLSVITKVAYVFFHIFIFALVGVGVVNPLFNVHFGYFKFVDLGFVIAFIGNLFTVFEQSREL